MGTKRTSLPRHLASFDQNQNDVVQLVVIHDRIAKLPIFSRRGNVDVLNRSAVVLLVAAWEAYIEDLAEAAFQFMLTTASEPNTFPARVLALAARDLRSSPDERKVWELSGTGWRSVLATHRDAVIAKFVGSLNTPKPDQIDDMFERLIGLPNISGGWKWGGMTATQARRRLGELVTLRGSIAHRVQAGRATTRREVISAGDFVAKLAISSSNTCREHLHSITGAYPWKLFSLHLRKTA